jgi:hypothetical protein
VIDPHGGLASDVLASVPARRIDDVVYVNPADTEFPVGFNLLARVTKEKRPLVASGIVSVFKSIWRESWGPRLEYILYATVAALLECENVSLLAVPRMLSDERFRNSVVRRVTDPVVCSFWEHEFGNYNSGFSQEAVAPIQNKVGQLLMSPVVRNIVGQVTSRINARDVMDKGHIFIADLSKGKIGEDKANLLGALLVKQFELAAMSRSDVAEDERKDFFLYVDEFQSFATDSFVSILSEARKYRLSLVLSHQYMEQVPKEIRDAVFGNVGSIVSFRVGERDAEILEREFGGSYSRSHFAGLGNHEIVAKILCGGEYGEPFTGRTLPPVKVRHGRQETIIDVSRKRYATERTIVEDRIRRWHERSRH